MTTSLHEISPAQAQALVQSGKALVFDIREPDEHARERIDGAQLVSMSSFDAEKFSADRDKTAVFLCASGNRTTAAASEISNTGFAEICVLKGGLASWKKAGLPVTVNKAAPISIQRQVQLSAGSLMVLSVVLATLISPWFMALGAFVGAGLMFAGASGTCGMATVLAYMPWNRSPTGRGVSAPA